MFFLVNVNVILQHCYKVLTWNTDSCIHACLAEQPYYLVASTGKTSVSFSEDTFHSQKEGALHLILCRELKKHAKLFMLYYKSMSYTVQHPWGDAYREQSVNGKAGVLWGRPSFRRGLLGGCIHKCCFPSALPVEMNIYLWHIRPNISAEVTICLSNQPATGPSGQMLFLICTLFSHQEQQQKWSRLMSERNNKISVIIQDTNKSMVISYFLESISVDNVYTLQCVV